MNQLHTCASCAYLILTNKVGIFVHKSFSLKLTHCLLLVSTNTNHSGSTATVIIVKKKTLLFLLNDSNLRLNHMTVPELLSDYLDWHLLTTTALGHGVVDFLILKSLQMQPE